MDRGGIFCLHDSFCCSTALHTRLSHTTDARALRGAGKGRAKHYATPPLGVARKDVAPYASGRDGQ